MLTVTGICTLIFSWKFSKLILKNNYFSGQFECICFFVFGACSVQSDSGWQHCWIRTKVLCHFHYFNPVSSMCWIIFLNHASLFTLWLEKWGTIKLNGFRIPPCVNSFSSSLFLWNKEVMQNNHIDTFELRHNFLQPFWACICGSWR